jgi:hypothetical protein
MDPAMFAMPARLRLGMEAKNDCHRKNAGAGARIPDRGRTVKVMALFCGVGLLVSLLLATNGLNMGPGLF